MLIINADDLGRNKAATDNTLRCHSRGGISSTSAMVFMEDSERAFELARGSGIDAGLHINLSERFTGATMPPRLCEYHGQVSRFLKRNKYALLIYHPGLRTQFRYVFEAQYAEFQRLHGGPPSHLDGHQHLHLASNMLLQRILPAGTRVRRSFSFQSGEKSLVNRFYRAGVDRWLARRHRLADYFFALTSHPERLRTIFDLAKGANVELMTHPERRHDFQFLMSDDYAELVREVPVGTYATLESRERVRTNSPPALS